MWFIWRLRNKSNIEPESLAPLCSKLAATYDGGVISHFELSVFRNCKARLTHLANDDRIKSHFHMISEKLVLMEKNLFNPNSILPSLQTKPD